MNVVLNNNQCRSVSNSFSKITLFFLTILLWIDRILLTYIRAAMMSLPIIGSITDYIIIAVYVFLIFFSVPQIIKCMRFGDIFFLLTVVIIGLFNYLVFPANTKVLNELLPQFLLLTFPLYFIGLSLDFEKVYPWLYKLSLITIVAFTAYKLFVAEPMTDIQSMYEGDMWSAYNLLPHVCVVSLAMLKKPNIINIVISVMGIIMIASLGSRGPLLCSVVAIAVYLLFFKKHKKRFLAYFIIIAVATVIIMKLDDIMQFLYDLSQEAGLSIRVFEKFFEGSFSDSSTRDAIAKRLYDRIAEKPAFGYGIFADRVAVGTYAHNIAIELWHSFGVVFGTMILGGITIVLLRAATVVKKVEQYALLFIPLLFAGFIKLFLSNSFLEEIYLYWLLGIAVNFIRYSKKTNNKCDNGK